MNERGAKGLSREKRFALLRDRAQELLGLCWDVGWAGRAPVQECVCCTPAVCAPAVERGGNQGLRSSLKPGYRQVAEGLVFFEANPVKFLHFCINA